MSIRAKEPDAVERQSLDLSAAYLHPEMRTSITPDSPHDDRHDEQRETHVGGQYREKRGKKNIIVEHQSDVNIEKKRRRKNAVDRQSLDLSAAYLHAEMRTSITPDSPHDDGREEQCRAHVEGQYREKEKKKKRC